MPFSETPEEAPALKSAHARYARHTARTLGYDFRSLDGVDGYLFVVSDGRRRAYFSAAAGTPYAFNSAHANAIARDKAFAQIVLAERGLPTIPSRLFFANDRRIAMRTGGREPEDARAFAASADYPLFCKPISGAQGAFAEIVRNRPQFEGYIERVGAEHYAFLAQPVVSGAEHRVFVLAGRPLFTYRKLAPVLVGDGASSVAALMQAAVARNKADQELIVPETTRALDDAGRRFDRDHVAAPGVRLTLEGAANRALGGSSEPPTTAVPEAMAAFALACADAIGLDLAAVDLFETTAGLVVIEVNSNPAIKTLEDHGRWDVIETIWRANFEAALR